jgi:hypothetical protein
MWKCYICGEKYAMNICMGCGVRYCNDCYFVRCKNRDKR